MKILVTGAAGKLGRQTTSRLAAAGHDVLATDVTFFRDAPAPFALADLRDAESVYRLMAGAAVVVHLGNLPNRHVAPPCRIYADNMTIQGNVFQAASDLGVGRVLFASSVQAICGEPVSKRPSNVRRIPLPASGDSPAHPENPYGVTKRAGEIMLASHVEQYGFCGVSVRLPRLYAQTLPFLRDSGRTAVDTFCAHLMFLDAADFFVHLCTCPLEGYHCFLPAYRETPGNATAEELRREYFTENPLIDPGKPLRYLVDPEPIERITGWKVPPRTLPLYPL